MPRPRKLTPDILQAALIGLEAQRHRLVDRGDAQLLKMRDEDSRDEEARQRNSQAPDQWLGAFWRGIRRCFPLV